MTTLVDLSTVGAMILAYSPAAVKPAPPGGWLGGSVLLICALGLAGVLGGLVTIQGVAASRRRTRWASTGAAWPPPGTPDGHALRGGCGAAGLLVLLLAVGHLALGFETDLVGPRMAALSATAAAVLSAAGLLVLAQRRWSVNLADLGLGLLCVAACSAATLPLPAEPITLSGRAPMLFNAVLAALAVMTWLWSWLADVWRQQLDDDRPWTTAGRTIEPALRASRFCGLTAVAVAWLMTIWPRLPGVAVMDDTLGRLASGVAGHLLLLWAALWCGRRTGRSFYTALLVLALASLLAFVYVRRLPLVTAAF